MSIYDSVIVSLHRDFLQDSLVDGLLKCSSLIPRFQSKVNMELKLGMRPTFFPGVEVVVPGHHGNGYPSLRQVADLVCLYATVHSNDL